MVVVAHDPKARCDGPNGPLLNSCKTLLNSMPATKTKQVFGDARIPGVQVKLPYRLKSGRTIIEVTSNTKC